MNKHILLVNPANDKRLDKYPPLSLIWLSSYLESKGCRADILDANAFDMTFDETVKAIVATEAASCGFTFMTPQADYVTEIIKAVKGKRPDLKIIAGGVHVSILPREILARCPEIDYIVIGEGERTIVELLETLNSGLSTESLAGIGYRSGDHIAINARRPLMADLDELPMPAWGKLPVERYEVVTPDRVSDPSKGGGLTISSERGCPFNCTFCASGNVFGKSYRSRSPEKIVEEIEYIVATFNVRNFFFVDEVLTFSEDMVLGLCRLLREKNLKIKWACNSRCNAKGLTEKAIHAMKDAGCVRIDFGIESGSPAILRSINKGITVRDIYSAVSLAHRHGLSITALMIVGLPGETLDDIRATLHLVLNIEPEVLGFGAATPFPGTELHEIAVTHGWLRNDTWSELYIGNRNHVMRTEHFTSDRIVELSDYANSVSSIVTALSNYKRNGAISLIQTAKLYLKLLCDMNSTLSIADRKRWIQMFLQKRTKEDRIEATLNKMTLQCKPIDNNSYREATETFVESLVTGDHLHRFLIVFDKGAVNLPFLINSLRMRFKDKLHIYLYSAANEQLPEVAENEHISYRFDEDIRYDAVFYAANNKLSVFSVLAKVISICKYKLRGTAKKQFLVSYGLKVFAFDALTIAKVIRGVLEQLYDITLLPVTMLWLLYVTGKTNELQIKDSFIPARTGGKMPPADHGV
jgi:radical SAM superfamily enzyme YgiQ (UPF0313 family)